MLFVPPDTPKAEAPKTYKELFMKYLYINGGVAVVVVGGVPFPSADGNGAILALFLIRARTF